MLKFTTITTIWLNMKKPVKLLDFFKTLILCKLSLNIMYVLTVCLLRVTSI